jgi:hypothetical protein
MTFEVVKLYTGFARAIEERVFCQVAGFALPVMRIFGESGQVKTFGSGAT